MNVDISPYLPPRSSWTADAPIGSGSDGGGNAVCRRSILRITEFLLGKTLSNLGCPLTYATNKSSGETECDHEKTHPGGRQRTVASSRHAQHSAETRDPQRL